MLSHNWHMDEVCPYRKVPCQYMCGVGDMSRPKMQQHEANRCPLRLVACKWNCGIQTLLAEDQEAHEEKLCLEAEVKCEYGCPRRGILRREVIVHNVTCERRPMPCPLGGSCSVPFNELKVGVASNGVVWARDHGLRAS